MGVMQGALIIKSFLDQSFARLRGEYAWMMPYVFQNVQYDLATNQIYGDAWVKRAVDWFNNTEIPVLWNVALESDGPPMITLALLNASQSWETLGDVHDPATQTIELPQQSLSVPFTPTSWNPQLGIMGLPTAIGTATNVFAGTMSIKTQAGAIYPILQVNDPFTIELADGITDNFTNCTIVQPNPNGVLTLESVRVKETYAIMLHLISDPIHLIWLHSIVMFCLMAFKQDLLEGRGFENSTWSTSDFSKNFGDVEARYQRAFTLDGYTTMRYPKAQLGIVAGVGGGQMLVLNGGEPFEPKGPNYKGNPQ